MNMWRLASIRSATDSDWPVVEVLLVQCQLPIDGAREHLPRFRLATSDEGSVVAVAGLEVYKTTGLLRSMAVRPDWQGMGIARALLSEIVAVANQHGLRQLFLLTITASMYFEKFGFAEQPKVLAPAEIQASAEMRGACPASAVMMVRSLIA